MISDLPINTIIHGDALDVLRALPDASVDGVVTDPPYSSGGMFRRDRQSSASKKYQQSSTVIEYPEFAGDTRDQRGYTAWCAIWLAMCLRVVKPGGVVLTFTDWRQLPATTDAIQAGGWVWRGLAVWDKTEAARPLYGRIRNQCEYIVWGSNGKMALNNGRPCFPGVYRLPVVRQDKLHVAGKPINLMRGLLQIIPEGGVVLDPFAGSGTTCIAAEQEGRRYIGIELQREYVEIARKRLGQRAAVASTERASLWATSA